MKQRPRAGFSARPASSIRHGLAGQAAAWPGGTETVRPRATGPDGFLPGLAAHRKAVQRRLAPGAGRQWPAEFQCLPPTRWVGEGG
jgi:hypothetical protein